MNDTARKAAHSFQHFADLIDVHRDTVKNAANAGYLRTIRVGDRRLVPDSELTRVLREGLRTRKVGK